MMVGGEPVVFTELELIVVLTEIELLDAKVVLPL